MSQMKRPVRLKTDTRAPRVRGLAKLIELSVAFVLIGLIWAGSVWVIIAWQASRCPRDTFLSGSPPIAAIVVMLAPLFAAITPGLIVSNLLTGAVPAARRFVDGDADFRRSREFQSNRRWMLIAAGVLAAATLPVSLAASLSQFCLTPTAIVDRAAPWAPMRLYRWSAVRSVTTSCVRGSKGAWIGGYALGLPGGRSLDIMGGTAPAWAFQAQVFKVLHGVPFRFDASGVEPGCGAANVGMLKQRP